MSRDRLIAALVAAPAVVVALAVTSVELWRLREPEAALFTTPFVYSLAEAIDAGDLQRAYAFIRAGQDPNAPIVVRDEGGRQITVSPLAWARAKDRKDIEQMLRAFGATK
jgi:hypothetical protein